jgi:hypothetical protein
MSLPVRHTEFGYLILSGDDCRQNYSESGEESSVQGSENHGTLADDGKNTPYNPEEGNR